MPLVIKSAAEARREEEVMRQAREAAKPVPRTNDRSDYEMYQQKFKEICLKMRELYPEIGMFRGSFQEVNNLLYNEKYWNDGEMHKYLNMLGYLDKSLMYEAEALAITSPEPWWTIWEDELGPYDKSKDRTYD